MINRRRAITILAGAAALPAFGVLANTTNIANVAQWRGIALGAQGHIVLDHPDGAVLIKRAVDEIRRLEKIFSLYQENSQLSHLNANGFLNNPALELVELLSICSGLHARTKGAFDPTIQGLWALYAQEHSKNKTPSASQIANAMGITGWHHLDFSSRKISFDKKGVMLTLNGIAQGYIADKVTAIFKEQGVENVLVNTGEISALGGSKSNDFWPVKLGDSNGKKLQLRNESVATSAPLGTTFDTTQTTSHILDPRTGAPNAKWDQVSVISKTAAIADGLSTAFCLMNRAEIEKAAHKDTYHLV